MIDSQEFVLCKIRATSAWNTSLLREFHRSAHLPTLPQLSSWASHYQILVGPTFLTPWFRIELKNDTCFISLPKGLITALFLPNFFCEMGISSENTTVFRPQLTAKNEKKRRSTNQSHSVCPWKKTSTHSKPKKKGEKPGVRVSHCGITTLYKGGRKHAQSLVDDELGYGEDIDRFVISPGRFAPILSEIRKAEVVDFRTW